ncbi:hypothetical protein Hsw_3102 [Hymenobacter swuensis DY53]|uniref:Uncharacterized protein n=1 Tax=Hymenobacter swuensis DY53 TaxID=1227739 RepID=W8F3U6_9BACT|nr:hypothetical protein Hsw_3102 [Hymenobacter swuensis DY53]
MEGKPGEYFYNRICCIKPKNSQTGIRRPMTVFSMVLIHCIQ